MSKYGVLLVSVFFLGALWSSAASAQGSEATPAAVEAQAGTQNSAGVIMPKQDRPAPVKAAAKAKAEKPTADAIGYKKPETFVPSERLENMRYQHLWLAYAFVWLFVFFFIFRTWQMNRATTEELALVRAKLAALEDKDGDA